MDVGVMEKNEEYSEQESVESQRVSILVKEGKITEAKEICKQFPDDKQVQSRLIKILIREKNNTEAKEICEKFLTDGPIQSQLITILMNEGKIAEAKKICEKFPAHGPIQSQLITMLMKEGKIAEAKKICEKFPDSEPIQSQLITILMNEGKIAEAKKICQKFPVYGPIQSQLITILMNEEKIAEAKKICEKIPAHEPIQSQLIKILMKEGKIAEAKKICKKFPAYEPIQSQLITILMKEGKDIEAKKICEKFPDDEFIQSKLVTILRNEGKDAEVKEICEKFPRNEFIQSKLVKILIKEEKIEEAKKICQKFPHKAMIQLQLVSILKEQGDYESLREAYQIGTRKEFEYNKHMKKRVEEVEIMLKELEKWKKIDIEYSENDQKVLNTIKTKLYYDDIELQDIEKVKQNDEELDEWTKTIVLLAIYDKQKNTKMSATVFKQSQSSFKDDAMKMKVLNRLKDIILSKKPRIFDWSMFDDLLKWELDTEVEKEIMDKKAKKENVFVIKKEVEEPKKQQPIYQKIPKKSRQMVEVYLQSNKESVSKPSEKTTKLKTKPVKKILPKPTIGEVFDSEISKMKMDILLKHSSDALTQNQKLELLEEFDRLENIEDTVMDNFRAKMQMVLFLRKYDMKSVADSKLEAESEIYDDINKMYSLQRNNPDFDCSEFAKNIMNKVAKIQGDNQFAYKLLDKVIEKGDER